MALTIALYLAGMFTVALGILHFFFPVLLDFKQAIPKNGTPLKPFHIFFYHYETKRSDVHGIAWVMNHCVSYVIVTIGLLDLFSTKWLHTSVGCALALWIAGWWLLRAITQLYLGRRRGDWFTLIWFSLISLLHVAAAYD